MTKIEAIAKAIKIMDDGFMAPETKKTRIINLIDDSYEYAYSEGCIDSDNDKGLMGDT